MKNVQLICIGYAGSVASAFNILSKHFGEEVVVTSVEYRGRGKRNRESGYSDNHDMENDVAEQIKQLRLPETPYAILGYSMGVQVVYELFAKGLLDEVPVCTFLAAHEPPDVDCFGKSVELANDEEFIKQLQRYGGMDLRLLEDNRFREIYLSRMRVDYQRLKEYRFSGDYVKIPSKVVMCYCEKDTPYDVIKGWKRFSDDIAFYELGDNHFFYKSDTKEFCEIIRREVENFE